MAIERFVELSMCASSWQRFDSRKVWWEWAIRSPWTTKRDAWLHNMKIYVNIFNICSILTEMASALMFLGLLACSSAQLIYPDQYEMMKTSTIPPYFYTTPGRLTKPSGTRLVTHAKSNSPPVEQQVVHAFLESEISTTQHPSQVDSKSTENPLEDWGNHVSTLHNV